jgi:hypothetical protein
MNVTLNVSQITIEGCNENMFVPFFEIDADFSDNQEYFREDTISLGYENEAERCSEELYKKHFEDGADGYGETLQTALEEGAEMSINGNQFILGNTTYTSQFNISVVCVDRNENEYEVIIAYNTK